MEKKDKDSITDIIKGLDISEEEQREAIDYFCNFESLEALLSWNPYHHREVIMANPFFGMIHSDVKTALEGWKVLVVPTTTSYLDMVNLNVDFIDWGEPFVDFPISEENTSRITELWTSLLEPVKKGEEVVEEPYLPYDNSKHHLAQKIVKYVMSVLYEEFQLGTRELRLAEDNNGHVGGVHYPDISILANSPYIDVEVKPRINTKKARKALKDGNLLKLPTNSPIPGTDPRKDYGHAKEALKQIFSRSAEYAEKNGSMSNYGIISDGHSWIFFEVDNRYPAKCRYSQLYDFYWDSVMPDCFMILAKMMLKVLDMAGGALSKPVFQEFPYKRIFRNIEVDSEDGKRTMVLLHEVYVGSNSEVYIAREEKSKRISALKIYHCNDQYENESRVLPLLAGCTGVPQVEFVGRFRDSPVISIFPIGSTLQDIMTKKKLSSDEVLDIGCCLFRILECIHNRGVVHGDIKPSNLLVTPDNRLFIIDYGSAYLAEEGRRTKLMVTDLFSPRMVSAFGVYPGMNGDLESAYFTINFLLDRTLSWADGGRKPSLEDIASSKPELKVLSRYVLDRMGESFNKLNPVDIDSYMI